MSDTVDLAFIGMRLDTIQKDGADVRRRLVDLSGRFNEFEHRFSILEQRFGSQEVRFDHLVDRISGLEANMAEVLLLMRRLAPPA